MKSGRNECAFARLERNGGFEVGTKVHAGTLDGGVCRERVVGVVDNIDLHD